MISVQHNGCYTSYPIHQFLHPQQLIRCASIKDTKWVKQLLLAFTAGQVHGPSTLKTLFSSDSGRSKPPSKTSGTIVAIKIQISIHQKKALSELCRTITIGRCELRWCESYSRFKWKTAGIHDFSQRAANGTLIVCCALVACQRVGRLSM